MKRSIKTLLAAVALLAAIPAAMADRVFVHPGISYTQADLDRMKSMVDAKKEPYYSTFLQLKNSDYSATGGSVTQRGTQIKEGAYNGTVGIDGRKAHDLALLYRITGETKYADQAVKLLNANSYYTNTSSRGTGPLDAGKINMLIEAAELLRDYAGWGSADQQRFRDMLVYPGYSTVEDFYEMYASNDETKNAITFYWNCYNFDAGRFGNQGMFAARALLCMGIYLDNDTIFDRAYQYLIGHQEQHFENYEDIMYVPGPRSHAKTNSSVTQYLVTANQSTNYNDSLNWGYDEQLQYYIFKNGQSQESCRDQGHCQCGIMMYTNMAEICWNQGEDLYGALDNRILKGIEYNTRVNVTALKDYTTYCSDKDWSSQWVPSSYSVSGTKPSEDWVPLDEELKNNVEPTDPSVFYQTWSRSARWFYKDLHTEDAGDVLGSGGCREMAYAHYKIRLGLPSEDVLWLSRDRNYMLGKYGCENWGKDSGHYYEWCGWGTLSKHREPYMTGDPVSYQSGKRIMGAHSVFETIHCVDFDYFTTLGNGHTYYNGGQTKYASMYRTDEQVGIEQGDSNYVLCNLKNGAWFNYTYSIPDDGDYELSIRYLAGENSPMITLLTDGEETGDIFSEDTNGKYVTSSFGQVTLTAGIHVFRILIQGDDADLKLSTIELKTQATAYTISYGEGITGPKQALEGQTVNMTVDSSVVSGSLIVYDETAKSKIATAPFGDSGDSFTMPANNVKVTCLNHPSGGVTYIATIAVSTAGVGSAYARSDHPDVFTVYVPAEDSVYTKAVYTHPYKTHNYNRQNLRLECPDGYVLDVNSIYDQPWDVSGHVVFGQTNTFRLLNDKSSGIDYWANGIATEAELLTRLSLSEKKAQFELGDVNGDGKINIGDIVGLTNLILGIEGENLHSEVADVNCDGKINVGDCVALTNKILTI